MRIRSDKAFLAKNGHFGLKVEVLLISVFKKSQLIPHRLYNEMNGFEEAR